MTPKPPNGVLRVELRSSYSLYKFQYQVLTSPIGGLGGQNLDKKEIR